MISFTAPLLQSTMHGNLLIDMTYSVHSNFYRHHFSTISRSGSRYSARGLQV